MHTPHAHCKTSLECDHETPIASRPCHCFLGSPSFTCQSDDIRFEEMVLKWDALRHTLQLWRAHVKSQMWGAFPWPVRVAEEEEEEEAEERVGVGERSKAHGARMKLCAAA